MDPAAALTQTLAALATERCGAARVEVRWLGVDPARLPAGGAPAWDGDPCRPHPELSLWWTTGGDADRYTVHPELVVWVPAKVAARATPAGQPVTPVDGEAPLDALVGGAWTGTGAPLALRALRAGDPLCAATVRSPADAATGATVVLRVRSGSLEIRSDGRLLEDGWVGKPVRAYVNATQSVVTGLLSDPGTVDL